MKKLMMAIAITSIFAACQGKKETLESKNTGVLIDTSTLYDNSASTDMASMAQNQVLPVYAANTNVRTSNNRQSTSNRVNRSASTSNAGTTSNNSTNAVQPVRKKGMSSAAKDAIIGGVGGAVIGAVVSKNKVKGAVIGGVIGGAGGYIIGRKKDKRTGRVR